MKWYYSTLVLIVVGVCVDVKSKVGDMLKKYPRIKAYQVDIDDSIKIATNYSIFTIPAILLFIRGKETIREARHISILDLDKKNCQILYIVI